MLQYFHCSVISWRLGVAAEGGGGDYMSGLPLSRPLHCMQMGSLDWTGSSSDAAYRAARRHVRCSHLPPLPTCSCRLSGLLRSQAARRARAASHAACNCCPLPPLFSANRWAALMTTAAAVTMRTEQARQH